MSETDLPEHIENPDFDDEDDDEEIAMTSREALQELENAWLNEKFAPEILPNRAELVELMLAQTEHIENNLEGLERTSLKLTMHTLELSRIKYIISSYLRIRIAKIERYVDHLLQEESDRTEDEKYLTPNELQFATEYSNSVQKVFNDLALSHMPEPLRDKQWMIKPNLETHVFCKVKKNVDGIKVQGTQEDEEIDLQVGSQHIIKYKAIAHLVKDGSVQLI